MYSREVNGQVLEFGVSGKLMMNVLVMYDRQTNSLWSQLLGKAIEGPLKGTELEFVPSKHTTWADWRREHPDTLALVKGYSGYRDPYAGYYRSGQAGVLGETNRDPRLSTKQFVIGVAIGEDAVAYPFSVLSEQPAINDEVGGVPVLVVFDAANASGVVYERTVQEQVLTFEVVEGLTLRDKETGSLWDGEAGRALEGPLAGTQLQQVKSTSSFWFGWSDFYPHTRVYGIDDDADT